MRLLKFTHFGAIRNHLNDFILFKNTVYNPDIKQKTKFKVEYIKRIRSDKKSSAIKFIKIDRKIKKNNDRIKIQHNSFDF